MYGYNPGQFQRPPPPGGMQQPGVGFNPPSAPMMMGNQQGRPMAPGVGFAPPPPGSGGPPPPQQSNMMNTPLPPGGMQQPPPPGAGMQNLNAGMGRMSINTNQP